MEKYLFYTAVTICCDAAHVLANRYADECLKKAETVDDEARKKELEEMADGLRWIADNPARGFREACQAELLYIQMVLMAGTGDVGSCGRFDQITGKYLEKDLAEGKITEDQAQEIVDNFFLNISRNWGGGLPELVKIIGIGNTYMHTTIGGTDPQTGKDATNKVTYMVLEAVGRMGLHDPTVSLRMTKDTPKELIECAVETTKLVGGLPLYYNDDVLIPAMQKELGFTLEEARDYALIGCQELTGSGIEYSCCNGIAPPHGSVYYSVVLDMAINNGKNPMNGEQASIETGYLYDMKNIEEVKEAFIKMARYVLRAHISINNFMEYVFAYNLPQAIISMSVEGCMEKGKDVINGGAKYTSFGGTATGLATVADSLSTIEYACFDKKICTTKELYDAVMANWKGYEELQQKLIAKVPHFGNNDPYADKWMTWVTETYYSLCQEMSSHYAKYYRAGLYGAADHVGQGYVTWATPDGREAGKPIADAASPAQGRDKNGPTSVLNSSCCYDHGKFMDGVCLNIRIHPSALSREDGNQKLGSMIRAYMDQGGAEVQFNVVSSETMRAAQENPEEYKDLVVRIAGYSAYFVELSKDCQNDLITRSENVI
ncbi:formate C-acetyltransferase [Acetitomaculum ruminis DSM 5522]|uniref:Formate C-acetyltransferase n=1 Tax=Acetitomaculum ruminis DSM 5522 TaxID=1120918 RepID=A0A1I0W0K2_9FIRM|nr:formate C-acetyltransferase [Acetitomaculum ruminis DSM 5522]